MDYDFVYKILVIGNSTVGKSSLLSRFVDNIVHENHLATIGVDFKIKTMVVDGKKVKLQIWDTAGQERFRSIVASYYKNADAVILMYDITNRESFREISKWNIELDEYGPSDVVKILVGNKSDLDSLRQVTPQEGESLEFIFFETSAIKNVNVQAVFDELVSNLIVRDIHKYDTDKVKVKIGPSVRITSEKKNNCCFV